MENEVERAGRLRRARVQRHRANETGEQTQQRSLRYFTNLQKVFHFFMGTLSHLRLLVCHLQYNSMYTPCVSLVPRPNTSLREASSVHAYT